MNQKQFLKAFKFLHSTASKGRRQMHPAVAPQLVNFLRITHCIKMKVNLLETYKTATNYIKKNAYVLYC